MPDRRSHRGAHPEDAKLFAPDAWPALRSAVADLSWLFTRGYAQPSALKVVGDRSDLTERQRVAVMRCACSDQARAARAAKRVDAETVRGAALLVDGYNVLTTVEAALGGGVILAARDGCYRDIASMHGTYRKVDETVPALGLVGEVLAEIGAGPVAWLLDSPVSNSGRLKTILRETAESRGWSWTVELVQNPDALLATSAAVVATADSVVLDRCRQWLNLARLVVGSRAGAAFLVDLSNSG